MSMLQEFKKFAIKGNMIDLAVGVIIGGAFNTLVNSLVKDVIMPILGVFTGGLDFTNWFIALDGNEYATLAQAQEAGAATVNYGTFISGVLNFIIMAFVVFLMVKAINKLRDLDKKSEAPAAPAEPTTKTCPHCQSTIHIKATKCPYCTSDVE